MELAHHIIVDCAGGCGKKVSLAQSVCRACVEDIMEWRRTYDGPAPMSDEAERMMLEAFQRVLADPNAI